METQLCYLSVENLSEIELQEIEGGGMILIACCAIAFATGMATSLMIL